MAVNTSQVAVTAYASTNVTTSAYLPIIAGTAVACSKLEITDTSGKVIKVAVGDQGNQKDICSAAVSGTVIVPVYIPAGSNVWLKAIDSTASTGFNVVSLLG